ELGLELRQVIALYLLMQRPKVTDRRHRGIHLALRDGPAMQKLAHLLLDAFGVTVHLPLRRVCRSRQFTVDTPMDTLALILRDSTRVSHSRVQGGIVLRSLPSLC